MQQNADNSLNETHCQSQENSARQQKQNMKPNLHRSGSKTTQSVPGVQNLCPDAAAHSVLMQPDRVCVASLQQKQDATQLIGLFWHCLADVSLNMYLDVNI